MRESQNWSAKRKNDLSSLYGKENYGGSIFKDGSKECNKKVYKYSDNDEKNEFIKQEIGIGDVIVATNLAGRGKNLAISPGLKKMEVCTK